MNAEPRRAHADVRTASVLAGLILVPVLYLLLLGPLLSLYCVNAVSDDVWSIATHPVVLCGDYLRDEPEWFWQTYDRYLSLWVVGAESP